MRNFSNFLLLISVFINLVLGYLVFQRQEPRPSLETKHEEKPEVKCEAVAPKVLTMQDDDMKGILNKGQKFQLFENWYQCHSLERNDLVYYRFSTLKDPVVKVARAVEGDKFKIFKKENQNSWNIEINGKPLKIEGSEDLYYFGAGQPTPLHLYEKANSGVISKNLAILFSTIPPGHDDSGLFGVASTQDFAGKVIPVSE